MRSMQKEGLRFAGDALRRRGTCVAGAALAKLVRSRGPASVGCDDPEERKSSASVTKRRLTQWWSVAHNRANALAKQWDGRCITCAFHPEAVAAHSSARQRCALSVVNVAPPGVTFGRECSTSTTITVNTEGYTLKCV